MINFAQRLLIPHDQDPHFTAVKTSKSQVAHSFYVTEDVPYSSSFLEAHTSVTVAMEMQYSACKLRFPARGQQTGYVPCFRAAPVDFCRLPTATCYRTVYHYTSRSLSERSHATNQTYNSAHLLLYTS